jgi:hypothetical protein
MDALIASLHEMSPRQRAELFAHVTNLTAGLNDGPGAIQMRRPVPAEPRTAAAANHAHTSGFALEDLNPNLLTSNLVTEARADQIELRLKALETETQKRTHNEDENKGDDKDEEPV